MSLRNHALPIFLLYIVTSVLFLAICSWLYYHNAKNDLIRHMGSELFAAAREIDYAIKTMEPENLSYDMIDDDITIQILSAKISTDFDINFFDKLQKEGEFKIINSHDLKNLTTKFNNNENVEKRPGRSLKKPEKYISPFYFQDNQICLDNSVGSRRFGMFKLKLCNDEFGEEKQELIMQIVIFALCAMVLFLVVSYFIVLLSFRPLFAQIKALNSFITDATHEINTPLSVILMSVEMFDINPKKYLNNIKVASKTLSNLYDDLVNLNLKTNEVVLESVKIDELIKERISYFEIMLNDKNLQISENLLDVNLQTDTSKFKKIFDNILSNAIKYCDENSEILVNLNKDYFEIINQGATISKDAQKKMYDKFTRFNNQKGGFGIGLSLVKRFCDELGFSVRCISENQTTNFRVNFKK